MPDIHQALEKLGADFSSLDLTFHPMEGAREGDVTSFWPGPEQDDALVCVFKGTKIEEPFHRQDFFFMNYAYQNSYQAFSGKNNNAITILENECYIGQPYSGYALRCDNEEETVIIGVLIQKDAFFHEYLSLVYEDADLFRFFIEPTSNRFSDNIIHLPATQDHAIRALLEMMVIEYADRKADTQRMLKSLLHTLILQIARRYQLAYTKQTSDSITVKIVRHINDHSDTVTLNSLSKAFSYHPNYISALLPRETGKTFTEILLEKRMERAAMLIRNTTLTIEEIAAMLGYSHQSNFYKAFKSYYKVSPREWVPSD